MQVRFEKYAAEVQKCFSEVQPDRLTTIATYLKRAQTIYIIGNGGSASTASHMAVDFIKAGLPAIALVEPGQITAHGNDDGYESVFVNQLRPLLEKEDVVLAVSASGNSQNVLRAVKFANQRGAVTLGFIGFEGGALRELVDLDITVSSKNYGVVEDFHLSLNHIISQSFPREKMKTTLYITGQEGYIGSHFIMRMLKTHGVSVDHMTCDLLGGWDYRKIEGGEFEYVVHFAADSSVTKSLADPDGCIDNNALGLIPFLTKNKIGKFIFTSTGGAIYGNKLNAKEEDASWAGCISPYGQSKYLAEKIIRKLQPNHCILRLGNVYGGNDSDRLELAAHARFKKDNPVVLYGGNQIRDFVHVDTVCDAILQAMHLDVVGTFNIGGGEGTRVEDVAKKIAIERGVSLRYYPKRDGEIDEVSLDVTKAREAGLL